MDEIYAELHELVRERLENWPARREGYHWPGYTYDHTLRVVNLATQMARRVGADVEVVRFAALLHDIRKDAGREHAELGAAEVRTLLPRYHLPADFVEQRLDLRPGFRVRCIEPGEQSGCIEEHAAPIVGADRGVGGGIVLPKRLLRALEGARINATGRRSWRRRCRCRW